MGFKKPMDYNQVRHQIYIAGVELCSPKNDGFTQWEIKKDLYQLKWLLEAIIKDSGTFVDEEEFLIEREKALVWRNLKN